MTKRSDASTARAQASLLTVLVVASVTPAMAYIDPGTGSMVVQMALAGIAGALFYFRQPLRWSGRTANRRRSGG